MLQAEIQQRDAHFQKPLIILETKNGQGIKPHCQCLEQTFAGRGKQTGWTRAAPLSKLCIGLECGGSVQPSFRTFGQPDAGGDLSDMLVALGMAR